MTIGILLIIIIISLLVFGLILCNEINGGVYGKEIDKAFKDAEKGITTIITDDPKNSSFSVKKYKDGKRL